MMKLSSYQCGTRVTSGLPIGATSDYQITALRFLSKFDLMIDKTKVLGRGVFGKCFSAKLGHREVCVKVFRMEPIYTATFPIEAVLLGLCCHENLPWLYGICNDDAQKMSLHTCQGSPIYHPQFAL